VAKAPVAIGKQGVGRVSGNLLGGVVAKAPVKTVSF